MAMNIKNHISESRLDTLYFYSTYNFIRKLNSKLLIEIEIERLISDSIDKVIIEVNGSSFLFFFSKLHWDSKYFGLETFKLENVFFTTNVFSDLVEAVSIFKNNHLPKDSYCFINVPSEDTLLLQALGYSGFNLIETRLHYFFDTSEIKSLKRYPVRKAIDADIKNLSNVASKNRNQFDRIHADQSYSNEQADAYLATYITSAIKGFNDLVIVPNAPDTYPNAFLSGNIQIANEQLNCKISQITLTAVDPTSKGWHYNLLSEASHLFHEHGSEYIYMITQSTNRAVIHNCNKLGYKLGATSHILSLKK